MFFFFIFHTFEVNMYKLFQSRKNNLYFKNGQKKSNRNAWDG